MWGGKVKAECLKLRTSVLSTFEKKKKISNLALGHVKHGLGKRKIYKILMLLYL